MNPITVTEQLASVGMRVMRGPSWEWGDQDGGRGSTGTIISEPVDGWVTVRWNNETTQDYRVGAMGGYYDLVVYDPFTSAALKTFPSSQRVQEVREALTNIKKTDSKTEKSNTDYGHTNTGIRTGPSGGIKVRRPTCKI